jgi:enterochelin esterase family protein
VQSPRIARLIADPDPRAVDRFWAEVSATGTPMIEPWGDGAVLVTFLWRGEASSTRAWWNVDIPLTRVAGTDLWYGSEVFPDDLCTIYCLLHDGAQAIPTSPDGTGSAHIDTANPGRVHFPGDPQDPGDRDYWVSSLELPGAPADLWSTARPGVPPGRLTTATLGGVHTVTAYRPADAPTEELPTLVVFDGYLAQMMMRVPTVLDNLIAAGRIPPVTALFVHNRAERRERDLSPLPAMQTFVADELLPWARTAWGIGSGAGGNLVAGSSRGGLVAAYLGLCRPDLFGAVIAQSGSFWWPTPDEGEPGMLIREAARMPDAGVRFYLEVGSMETGPGPGGAPSQVTACREMRDALRANGHEVTYAEYTGGHDYVNWRRTFADGLIAVRGNPVISPVTL